MSEVLQMLEDIEDREEKLTDWERKFIDDIQSKIEKFGVTEKQEAIIDKIWGRVTS